MTELLDRPTAGRSRTGRAAGDGPRIDPRIARRWVEARREEGRRRLRILLVVASVATVVGLGVGSLYTPLFALRHIRVTATGGSAVSVARIEAEGGLLHHPLLVDVNPASVARRLDADPLLGAARVAKHWPATVTVTVAERVPLAQVPVAGGAGAGAYVEVDETGRVLGAPGPRVTGLPVIQGVGPVPAAGGWIPGSPGPAAVPGSGSAALVDMNAASDAPDVPRAAAAALSVLQALPAGLRSAVQSVSIASGSGLSLVMAPPRLPVGTVAMTLGDGSQLAAKVTALETLVAQAPLSGVSSIDLSVPSRPAAVTATGATGAQSGAPTGTATPATGTATPATGSATSGTGTATAAGGSATATPPAAASGRG